MIYAAPEPLPDSARVRREGNALDDGTEPPRPRHDPTSHDFTAAVERLMDASSQERRTR